MHGCAKGAPAEAAGHSLSLPSGAGGVGREVVDPMGSPMAAADVTVTALDTRRVVARGTTGPYGFFLAALPPGRYSPLIATEGLRAHREAVAVVAGAAAPVERVTHVHGRFGQLDLDVQAMYRTHDTPAPAE